MSPAPRPERRSGATRGLALLGLRRWREHPGRTGLSVVGVAVGAALVVAVTALSGSLTGSIERATAGLAGRADLEVSSVGDGGLDQAFAERLAATAGVGAAAPLLRAPVRIGATEALLLGADQRADAVGAGLGDALGPAERARLVQAVGAALQRGERPLVVGRGLARLERLAEGSATTVTVAGRPVQATIAAIVGGDAVEQVNGGVLAFADLATAQAVTGRPGQVDQLLVVAAPGTTTSALRAALTASADGRAVVASPALKVRQARAATAPITQGMLLSSTLAVGVGGFLVFTTMSMAALERRRELATLRALGGDRRRLLRAFLLEAAVLGAVGSALGIALGIAVARPLVGALPAFIVASFGVRVGFILPPAAIPLGIAAGLGSTLLAAIGPGRRAVRVAPVEAMKPEGVLEDRTDEATIHVRPLVFGVACTAVGVLAFTFGPGSSGFGGFGLLMIGIPSITNGLSRPLTTLTARVAGRLGPVGRLAAASVERAPRRAWVTTAAVLVAVGLVVGQGGVVDSTTRSVAGNVASVGATDYYIDSNASGAVVSSSTLLPDAWRARAAALPGVRQVGATQFGALTIGEDLLLLQGVTEGVHDPSLELVRPAARPQLLEGRGIAVSTVFADRNGLRRGSRYVLPTSTGPVDLEVVEVVENFKSTTGVLIISLELLQRAFARPGTSALYVDLERGIAPEQRAAVVSALEAMVAEAPFPVGVVTGAAFRDGIRRSAEQGQQAFVAMQWVIVGAALLAVLNAFLIAVVERRRELGILRAIGTGRRALGSMVVAEAVAVGIVGTVIGIGFGLAVHGLAIGALRRATNLPLHFYATPWPAARAVVVGLGVALLGSWLPARRAARVDVLSAIGYE